MGFPRCDPGAAGPGLVLRGVAVGRSCRALTTPAVLDALWLSAITTAVSVVLVVLLGFRCRLLSREVALPGRTVIETIVDLPIVLPPSVAGLALLLVFGRRGLFGDELAAPGADAAVHHGGGRSSRSSLSRRRSSSGLRAPGFGGVERGAGGRRARRRRPERSVFRSMTAPLAAPALSAGLVMCWARALGEFGATIIFAGSIEGRTQTLPLLVYGEFQSSDLDSAIAAAVVLVLAAVLALGLVRGLHWTRVLDTRLAV